MGRTRGEPDEIELTAMGVKLNGLALQACPLRSIANHAESMFCLLDIMGKWSLSQVRVSKKAFFGRVFFLISSGGQAPHVRCTPMGRACGEPDEPELTRMGVELNTRILAGLDPAPDHRQHAIPHRDGRERLARR